jgi:serine/threonine protein phosphatase PrpC
VTKEVSTKDFVLNEPEIRITTINYDTDEFIILASDGLFDRFTSEESIKFATEAFLK